MDRKRFLSALSLLTAGSSLLISANERIAPVGKPIIPPYLRSGDTIGITSPAGHISLEAVQPAKLLLEQWGFKVLVGATIGKQDFTFGGSDEERTADLQRMLDDPGIKAIMCARGGYGLIRIIDRVNLAILSNQPKWLIGFSDVTVIHSHLNRQLNMASIHAKMCNSFPDVWEQAELIQVETILSIKNALTGTELYYKAPISQYNKLGKAKGQLIGGNLSILETLSGTASAMKTAGKILFLEDTGEYLYRIDRMLWNLKRSGMLSGLAGLIIGNFKVKADDPGEEFGRTVYDIVLEKIKEYSFPVCFEFPVGHQRNNVALRCGIAHELSVTASGRSLKSLA